MQELAPIIHDLAIMLGIASVVILLFQKIRQPVILGYIIAGIIIGPYTPPYALVSDTMQIYTLSELGVIFLMFALGLDFSFHKLKRIGISAAITGLIKVTIMVILGMVAGRLMHWDFYNCLFLGIALAISSTMIIIKAFEELKLQGKKFADIVLGILIVEDLLAILILTTLSTSGVTKNFLSLDIIFAVITLIFVIGSWFLVGYFLVPILFRKIIKYVNQETLTVVSIALCLGLAVIAAYFHYSAALGAFIMGSILAETPFSCRIQQLANPLRDVFAAVFFISIGMLIDLRVLLNHWLIILALSLLTIIGKLVATTLGTFATGESTKTSIRAGFSMAPIGEFSFIIISVGTALNVTSDLLKQIIVGVAATTTLATPYLMRLANVVTTKLEATLSSRTKYFLESYSAWVYRALASYKKQKDYRKFALQLITNGIIVALIFVLTYDFVLPQFNLFPINNTLAKIYGWIIALLCSSPFIWGMLFSFKVVRKNRQTTLLFVGGIITTIQSIILSVAYFNSWYVPIITAVLAIVLFGLSYKQLGHSYHWFERQALYMLHKRQRKKTKYEELAPWDTHLVEITVINESATSVVGKTLSKNKLRQKFGVNVVAIKRGSKVILAPRGEEKILPYDTLIVLGNDEQIEAFKKETVEPTFDPKPEEILENLILKAVVLEANDPLIGNTIRDSNIRQQIGGFVVGIERDGLRMLNPDPATVLKTNDLLLLVGEAQAIFDFCNREPNTQ